MKNKRKRIISSMLLLSMIVSMSFSPNSYAATTNKTIIPRVDIFVGAKKIESNAFINENKRTMVPISLIGSELQFESKWDEKLQIVTITNGSTSLLIPINSSTAYVNGEKVEIDPGKDTKAVIKEGRTMVPLSFITNSFGMLSEWRPYLGGGGAVLIVTDKNPKEDVIVSDKPELPSNEPTNSLPNKKMSLSEEVLLLKENMKKDSELIKKMKINEEIPFKANMKAADFKNNKLYEIVKEGVEKNKKNKVEINIEGFGVSSIKKLSEAYELYSKDFEEFNISKHSVAISCVGEKECKMLIAVDKLSVEDELLVNRWVEQKAKQFSSKSKGVDLQVEQASYVTKLIATTFEYDQSLQNRTEYSGLISGEFVCSGYASLSKRFFDYYKIENKIMTGDAGGPHAWNKVKIGSEWLYIDNTFNDPIINGNNSEKDKNFVSFEFFLKDENSMRKTHTWK